MHWSADFIDLPVIARQGKTANAARYVALASPIAAMMDKVVADTKTGRQNIPRTPGHGLANGSRYLDFTA
jgi:hypothetical protein